MPAGRLLVIRGNSGSGKSTVARRLREQLVACGVSKVALIEQDYLRRIVLKEKETEGSDNVELIRQTVFFALRRGYDVILEGILSTERYRAVIVELIEASADGHAFYFDVAFEETLRRHSTKPNASEFGEPEMRDWYRPFDLLGVENEVVVPETLTIEAAVALILERFSEPARAEQPTHS
jgi:predicted kinase